MRVEDIKVGRFYMYRDGNTLEFVKQTDGRTVGYCGINVYGANKVIRFKKWNPCNTETISLIKITLLYGENKKIMRWVSKQLKSKVDK